MNFILNFILTLFIIFSGSALLFWAWRWALENFNLGHIQLQDLTSRGGYREISGDGDIESQRTQSTAGEFTEDE